jgi:hypothetical protein
LRQDVEGIEQWRPWLGKKVRVGSTETSGLGQILWEFAAYRGEQGRGKEEGGEEEGGEEQVTSSPQF